MSDTDQIISLSDPGEIDKKNHNIFDRNVILKSIVTAWFFPFLMLCIAAKVILRQTGHNQAWLDDFQWWLYEIACLVGIAMAVTTNSHVHVDIFYDGYSKPRQSKIDLFALGWLFLPFTLMVWDVTFHYAYSSVLA